ncbi:MAG TPA: ABC-2 family transporter protein [Acidimicrobiales bacterium]|jgi:ABC-2 type transport system permease protein
MRLDVEVARRSFRRHAAYRAATAAGVFTNTVFGFIDAYILIAVYQGRSAINGLTLSGALTYAFVKQGSLMFIGVFSPLELGERVRTGDVVTDLYRPVDVHRWWAADEAGRALFHLLARGLPPVALGALVFDLDLPASATRWAGFVLSAVLAVAVGFQLRFLVSLSAFWFLDQRGMHNLNMVMTGFVSGGLFPLPLLPDALFQVARLLPWACLLHLPMEVYLGRGLAGPLLVQAAWLAVLVGGARATLAAATRKVVLQGG